MGKASKWLRNLLTGKKEDKEKKNDTSLSLLEDVVLPTAIFAETPNQRRRWSFGKSSANTETGNHKTSNSLDAIASTRLVSREMIECWNDQNHSASNLSTFFVAGKYESEQKVTTTKQVLHNEAARTVVAAVNRQYGAPWHAAATKIQAFFRGHLARKALKALRGLVKIQALVRGHLVRKQTSEMLRCMHALMSIQVRARVQRIQMNEEPHLIVKRKLTYIEPGHDQLKKGDDENWNHAETRGSSRRNKDLTSHQQMKTREQDFCTNYSGQISISKQEHQSLQYPNQSPLTDKSRQFKQMSHGTPNRLPQQYYSVPGVNHMTVPQSPSVDYSDTTSQNSQFGHNYMANTQSSRAKLRSHSEPKQRPMKQKTKRSPSFGGIDTTPDNQKQIQSCNAKKSQQPWLIKIYRAAKSSKDIKCDSSGMGTNKVPLTAELLLQYEASN